MSGFVIVQANPANPQWPLAYLTRFEPGAIERSWDRSASLSHIFPDRNQAEAVALCIRSTYNSDRGWVIEVRPVIPPAAQAPSLSGPDSLGAVPEPPATLPLAQPSHCPNPDGGPARAGGIHPGAPNPVGLLFIDLARAVAAEVDCYCDEHVRVIAPCVHCLAVGALNAAGLPLVPA